MWIIFWNGFLYGKFELIKYHTKMISHCLMLDHNGDEALTKYVDNFLKDVSIWFNFN